MSDDAILAIERAIATGGLTAAVKLLLERLDRMQRNLDSMADTQGNMIRGHHQVTVTLGRLSETVARLAAEEARGG